MVEDAATNKHKTKTTRPKSTCLWTVNDVIKWYRRHCSEYPQYSDFFYQHEITGRALLRLNDNSLKRMGIENDTDREAIWREIAKQRLKADIIEFKETTFGFGI